MTRNDLIEKSAAYGKGHMRIAWPCIFVSLSAIVAWTFTRSPRADVTLLFLALIAAPIAMFLFLAQRLQRRLQLECPRCHFLLIKLKIVKSVLDTGNCPICREKIIDDAV